MIGRLSKVVKEVGRDTSGDATALSARKLRPKEKESDLPEPAGHSKEHTDEERNVEKVPGRFGYKLHLLVWIRHEVALG